MKKENPTIECACGCKQKLTLYDNHYRKRSFSFRGIYETKVEIKDILNVVTMPNEDVENYLLLEEMRRLKDDEEISYNEFKKMSL